MSSRPSPSSPWRGNSYEFFRLFELEHAWHAGSKRVETAVQVDVVSDEDTPGRSARHSRHQSIVCAAEPLEPDHGRQDDRGVFAVMRRVA